MESPLTKFERMYTTHSDAIFRFLFFKIGDRERAIELMQETFIRTWQYLRSGNTIEHEKAFLYRTARNLFINEIRTDRSSEPLDEEYIPSNIQTEPPDTSPEQSSEQKELLRRLDELPDSDRELLILRYIEDWSIKDIAALTNDRPNTISMRISRSLDRLKALYHPPSTS